LGDGQENERLRVNLTEYEKEKRALFGDFAETVRFILSRAIAENMALPRPQSIQARAKDIDSLRKKLTDRELLDSPSIENEIRDLAGVRPIFYTNGDVQTFLASGIIFENFEIEDARTHHPTAENEGRQYRGIHYTVRLGPARIALPEYARFAGLRCEIQVQTILNHAWSETTHDILYKRPDTEGFASRTFELIEARMKRVMDEYLLPAGYEIHRAQYDYQRAMAGKDLLDRDVLEKLKSSTSNNERYELIENLSEYVIPHYDEVAGVFSDLKDAILQAVRAARDTATETIQTPFGPIDGKTESDIERLAIGIFEQIRYADVPGAYSALTELFRTTSNKERRKEALVAVGRLSEYTLPVVNQVGYDVQAYLVDELSKLTSVELVADPEIPVEIYKGVLGTEIGGTTYSYDSITFRRGALQAHAVLNEIRSKAIDGLFRVLDLPVSETIKHSILLAINGASRLPYQADYSNELCETVLKDTLRIVELYGPRIRELPFEFRETLENHLRDEYERAKQVNSMDRFGEVARVTAGELASAIIELRDQINADDDFVIYKTLVGYESVFPPQWDDPEFLFAQVEEYRRERAYEFIEAIDTANIELWRARISRCAATQSNDLATFPTFGEFLTRLSAQKPDMAMVVLATNDPNLTRFLPAILLGLSQSGDQERYTMLVEACRQEPTRHLALARHFRFARPETIAPVVDLLKRAIANADASVVIELVVGAIAHAAEKPPLKVSVFFPGLEFLTRAKDTRWIYGGWYLSPAEAFFGGLSSEEAEKVMVNLIPLGRVDHHAERVLAYIAASHPTVVLEFFRRRLVLDGDERPESAIPFRLLELRTPLARDVKQTVSIIFGWFEEGDRLFRFGGGRLLHNIYPDLPAEFTALLSETLENEGSKGIEFILSVLENYEGDLALHELAKAIIQALPEEDDRRRARVTMLLSNTGVTRGEFGRVEAIRERKARMEAWLSDTRPKVRGFAERYIQDAASAIAAEQRRAEEERELQRRGFFADDERS
jgi:ppGpp synthetase/RelA/SpoT-type nucleotidyltranferase